MKKTILILLILTALSCAKKRDVKLAVVADAKISEMEDFSSAYIFYNDTNSTAELNRKNLISTTNWIIHTDKRLTLKEAIPQLDFLLRKREKAGLHKNESAKTYLSVSNTKTKSLSFIPIDSTFYMPNDEFAMFYIKEHPDFHMDLNTIRINFDHDNKITFDGNAIEKEELNQYLVAHINFTAPHKETLIYLNFDETLSVQHYIENLLLIDSLASNKVKIAKKQFIYNQDLIPDCSCAL